MRMSHIAAAAGLFIASLGVASTADAQPYRGNGWHNGHNEYRGHGPRDDRRWRGNRGSHRHCWTEWHHHHRVRVCR